MTYDELDSALAAAGALSSAAAQDRWVKIGAFDFPVHLNDITREYFRRSASLVDPTIGWAMTAIAENETDVAAAAALAASSSKASR